MTRQDAIDRAAAHYTSGRFRSDLARRLAAPTESQDESRFGTLRAYLEEQIAPDLAELGFSSAILDNPVPGFGPFLIAERQEGADLPTVLVYGHGDVVRGQEGAWREGLGPWTLVVEGDRWYGRGTADNKGQHSINIAALAAVMAARGGRLGFNAKLLIETGEECGSPGLRDLAMAQKDRLAADVLIASDGPRIAADRPTVFLGSRGGVNFDMWIDAREGGLRAGYRKSKGGGACPTAPGRSTKAATRPSRS